MEQGYEEGTVVFDKRTHGSWDCKILTAQNVLLQKGKGSWNKQAAMGYAESLLDFADQLKNDHWASIGYGVEWELGTPDIEQIIIKLFQKVARLNCQLHVVIVESSVAKFQLEKMLSIVADGYQLRFTESIPEAVEILKDSGFDISVAQIEDFIAQPY